MNLPPLPELPEAYGWFDIRGEAADGFTADQLRSYALSYGRAVQEACAKACEQVAADEEESSPHKNYELVALDCAAAIRNGVIREGSWRCPDCCGVAGCVTCAGTGVLPRSTD